MKLLTLFAVCLLSCVIATVLGQQAAAPQGAATRTGALAEPARYPLELASPRAAGSSPSPKDDSPPMPEGHRIFRAYPGLEYNIRAVVIGGSYPYRFALDQAPPGMTIDADTGEIRWPNPTAGQATPTITVTDAAGASQSSPWTITVSAEKFRFVDAMRGNDANAGTFDAPWKSIARIKASEAAGTTVYFRSGVYQATGMPTSGVEGDLWYRVELTGRFHPVQWLAFPGEKPLIDNGYVKDQSRGPFLRLSGGKDNPVYLDGIEIRNAWHIGMQFGSGPGHYAVFRRLAIHDIAESIDGANSAGIMTLTSPGAPSWYTAFQDLDFHHNAPGGIKQYSQRKLLWEDCQFRDSGSGPDLKADVARFEVRGCTFASNSHHYAGLFGNMHPSRGGEITGEIRYNRMLCGSSPTMLALEINQDGLANEIHIYRNTLVGVVQVRNTDSSDGPFRFSRNVIVNTVRAGDHIKLESVSDPTRITYSENLTGLPSDNLVDAEGKLTSQHRPFVGQRGHQVIRSPR